jgi:mannosyltransferase
VSTSGYPAPRFGGPKLSGLRLLDRVRSLSADERAITAIVVLAAVIRILTIDNQSLWADEALTAYETHLPFGAMLNTVAHVETTPPLYFVLIWIWAKVFGSGEVALRSISTLAGIALVPIAYLSARELVTRWAGVIAAAFVAVNPFLIWFSQEARAYMLLALLTGAGFLFFVRARDDPCRRNVTWWAALSALALMTHFFAGFAVAPEAAWLLWRWWLCARPRQQRVVIAVAAVVAVQLAMVPFAFTDTSHGTGWIAQVPRLQRVGTAALEWGVSILYRRGTVAQGLLGAAALAVAVLLLVVLAGDRRTKEGALVGAVVGGFVIIAPLALGLLGQDYFLSRNVIPAFIPLATVVAAACAAPRARIVGTALAVVLLTMFSVAAIIVQTHPYLQRPAWRNVARSLGPASVPRAILAADGTTADPLKIYLPDVAWVQPHARKVWISEVDVVGATKRLALVTGRAKVDAALAEPQRHPKGSALPRSVSPPGARLLIRERVDNWVVARFALSHPELVSINQLDRSAHRFFRRTPEALLVFVQQSAR